MRRPLRTILYAAVAALLVLFFVLPFVRQDRCRDAGGHFNRTTLTCNP